MEPVLLISIGAIAVLLLLSAFFSGSETALTAASRPHMHQLEQEGNRHAATVNQLSENKERLIGTILLGNNLVNVMASALATGMLIGIFGSAGIAYATAVMTVLILIFAEVLPKTVAINRSEQLALAVAPIMRALVIVMFPVTRSVEFIVRGTLRVFGIDIHDRLGLGGEAELRGAIELHDQGPEQEVRDERRMLRSILDLGDVDVGEIMTHRGGIVMVDVGQEPREIVEAVLASPYTRIPLWRGEPDNIVGVVHAKALLRAVRTETVDLGDLHVEDIATTPWFIPESTSLLDQLRAFRHRQEHFALVVDEYGALMGIVTLEDILEEIVGEIADEHDLPVAGVRTRPDGSYIVRGNATIRDLNREFEWRLPDEDAATLAGLIMHEARRIPEVGQVFAFHGFRFEIVRRKKNQITLIRISPLEMQQLDAAG
jgi:Mg2+/Co2+ transporter CorB